MARRTFPLPSLLVAVSVLAFATAGACTTLGGGESLDELASGQDEDDGDDDDGDTDDPNECGCEELLEECQDDQTDWDGECDSTECDADCEGGTSEDGQECQPCQDGDECTPPTEGICEEMYQECVNLCEQPPTEVCDYCDAHLDECLEGSAEGDDPEQSAEQCYAHYQMCQSECVDEDGGDDGDDCYECDSSFEDCTEGAQDEESWMQCHQAWESCSQQCNPQDTGEDCYDQFDECLSECSSDEERAHCEMQLNECLENCGD